LRGSYASSDGGEESLDAGVDPSDAIRYRPILDLIDAKNPGRAERLLLAPSGEPKSFAEAEGDKAWL
jgi:hypothetical protein